MDDNAAQAASREERRRRAAEQEQRAMSGLESIMHGGNLVEESMKISNEFTDAQTGRLSAWFRRLLGR
ncbi:hypothetical protein [Cryobacterium arcticum]|uniref:Uncharacterized protein n=1 Tax=Cryobacterium arcticum TaxID=670052 RepID=A0A317ZTX8_9MICO|nr:hypothetical protein [Cryobacterium arcticum]PXA70709.1 hypothetical protein CTB96_06430 [Cryobacterium arcticum]